MLSKIYRSADIKSPENSRYIEGYAVVFNSLSEDLGGFREIIRPSAITEDLINRSDICATVDHNNEYLMARQKFGKGNIEFRIDDHGLYFRYELANTEKANELLSHIQRGEIDSCSFCFGIDYDTPGGEKWYRDADGTQIREITRIDCLFDISAVIRPAYVQTNIKEAQARDLEHARNILKINNMIDFYLEMLNDIEK